MDRIVRILVALVFSAVVIGLFILLVIARDTRERTQREDAEAYVERNLR